jgi:hypothetical protein
MVGDSRELLPKGQLPCDLFVCFKHEGCHFLSLKKNQRVGSSSGKLDDKMGSTVQYKRRERQEVSLILAATPPQTGLARLAAVKHNMNSKSYQTEGSGERGGHLRTKQDASAPTWTRA